MATTLLKKQATAFQHPEARRYRRVDVDTPAEIVINTVNNFTGRLINISPGDAGIYCKTHVNLGDLAIIYAKNVDILPGRIVRTFPDGFAMSLTISEKHRRQLIETLFARRNQQYSAAIRERRATPRHQQADESTLCTLAGGPTIFVKIADMSVNGAAVESQKKPAIGTALRLGQRSGIVMRHTPKGFAISFDAPPAQLAQSSSDPQHL